MLRAIIRDRLRRRLSAPKRIGCSYRIASLSESPGFDASDWLRVEVMERFAATASPGCAIYQVKTNAIYQGR